jgi:hypothetical protein
VSDGTAVDDNEEGRERVLVLQGDGVRRGTSVVALVKPLHRQLAQRTEDEERVLVEYGGKRHAQPDAFLVAGRRRRATHVGVSSAVFIGDGGGGGCRRVRRHSIDGSGAAKSRAPVAVICARKLRRPASFDL